MGSVLGEAGVGADQLQTAVRLLGVTGGGVLGPEHDGAVRVGRGDIRTQRYQRGDGGAVSIDGAEPSTRDGIPGRDAKVSGTGPDLVACSD